MTHGVTSSLPLPSMSLRPPLYLRIMAVMCLAVALCRPEPAQAAIPEEWHQASYAYAADQTPLREVIRDFSQTFGVIPRIDNAVTGVVDGNLSASDASQILDRLATQYQFQWFVYNNTLYVSPTADQTSARIEISADAAPDLQNALGDIGLLDERFGWGEIPDEGIVLVTGPGEYVELVRQFAQQRKSEDEKKEVISFNLRYAQAGDRQISYRDKSLTIPGVATLLEDLLNPNGRSKTRFSGFTSDQTSGASPSNNTALGSLDGISSQLTQGLINQASPGDRKELRTLADSDNGIRVTADIRNNAVLIYDDPERRPIYENLIDQLDVPRDLVEVDAIIVDIDRNRLGALSSEWNIQGGNFGAGANLIPQGSSSTLFIQNYDDFFARLRTLEGEGAASLIANPSILTIDNQPAVIDLSDTDYITAVGERVANILPVTAGTTLRVIPHVVRQNSQRTNLSDQNVIQLDVNVEDGQLNESQITSDTPSVSRATVSTQAVVGEKRSLVIGGFHSTQSNQQRRRIPFLGHIPILGDLLFSSSENENSRRERLFIITPRLLGDQVNPAKYLPPSERYGLNNTMGDIARRQQGEDIERREIEQAMATFAASRIPAGFEPAENGRVPPSPCRSTDTMRVQRDSLQWYRGNRFDIGITVVRNTSQERQRFNEISCDGRQTIAVSAWPHVWLAPGEQTEVLIALRHPAPLPPGVRQRSSLLEPADRSGDQP